MTEDINKSRVMPPYFAKLIGPLFTFLWC